jgi:hypothetical protein
MGLSLGISTHSATQISLPPLILDLIIYVVHVVILLIVVSIVLESARLSMILKRQHMVQELISIRKLLPLQLILEIRCQTCKS